VFSDLRTVAREGAPRFLTEGVIARAFGLAETQGAFRVDAVSPVEAARKIHVPVLLIHGAEDTDTRPTHSRRVFEALAGPKQLLLVKGARHNESLRREETWRRIDAWLTEVLPPPSHDPSSRGPTCDMKSSTMTPRVRYPLPRARSRAG